MFKEEWRPYFSSLSPAYEIFSWLHDKFLSKTEWPTLTEYNELNDLYPRVTLSDLAIKFVPSQESGMNYEATIYQTGQIPTRAENWHDFFNTLIWLTFPHSKAKLNAQHYKFSSMRSEHPSRRSLVENLLTIFDESGIVVVSSDVILLELIRTMSWKELFWHHREFIQASLRCYIFGHALHEKLLNPYIGLVGHCLLIPVTAAFFQDSLTTQVESIDQKIMRWLTTLTSSSTPRELFPLPVLGLPGWYSESSVENFYENKSYFRSTRREIINSCIAAKARDN